MDADMVIILIPTKEETFAPYLTDTLNATIWIC